MPMENINKLIDSAISAVCGAPVGAGGARAPGPQRPVSEPGSDLRPQRSWIHSHSI